MGATKVRIRTENLESTKKQNPPQIVMACIYSDNSQAIGNTPLVRLNHVTRGCKASVLAKIEGRNPAYSVKCRVGANMIWDAENQGKLNRDKVIIEPTSGNTGIALAFTAAARGYRLVLTMPESMSIERRRVMAVLGAEIILTEAVRGMSGAINKAKEIAEKDPARYFMPSQFDNPANPEIHFKTTGPEIWNDCDGAIDVLVAGVGTGGTITGVSNYIKREKKKSITSVAVEPSSSPVITQTLNGEEIQPGPHKIQGIGAGFIPRNLDLSIIDRVEQVTNDESVTMALQLAQEEGLLVGISCGAAAAAAVRLAKQDEFAGKTIVVVLPDLAERYLSSVMFTDVPTGIIEQPLAI
ncbi:cysteine synthase A [cyanobiont of Ornithocercus magnificus]|nr:cysteine synthase A [cyanobiont of Ornithocercus magnificus]